MAMRLEKEAVLRLISSAFRPLKCDVELWDRDQKLRFKVIDPSGKSMLRATSVLMRRARDPNGLRFIVNAARNRVKAKGIELSPWNPTL